MKNAKISLPILLATIMLVVIIAVPFLAFNGSAAVLFKAPVGSYAETYAEQHRLPFEPAPASVADADETTFDDTFAYETRGGSIAITGVKTGGDVVIPAEINGAPVTAVSVNAVKYGVASLQFPSGVTSIDGVYQTPRYTAPFFAAIATILVAYVFAVLSAFVAMKRAKDDESTFYGIPLVYGGVMTLLAVGVWCTFAVFARLSLPVQLIVSLVILAVAAAVLFMRSAARSSITATGSRVRSQTAYIKLLTADAQSLIAQAHSEEAGRSANRVYETVRFSDPMSNEQLADVEARISAIFEAYKAAVAADDAASIASLENKLKALFAERNNKCKALK